KMKVLIVSGSMQVGGPSTYHAAVARALTARGHEVYVAPLSCPVDYNVINELRSCGASVTDELDDEGLLQFAANLRPDIIMESNINYAIEYGLAGLSSQTVVAVTHTSPDFVEAKSVFQTIASRKNILC